MKWVKLLKGFRTFNEGEIHGIESDAEADMLVDTGVAELTTEPANVAKSAEGLATKMLENVGTQIDAAVAAAVTKITDSFAAGADAAKSKRPAITTHDRVEDDPFCGFAGAGHEQKEIALGNLALAVKNASMRSGFDDRLKLLATKAPTNYAQEAVGQDGGFLVPPMMLNDIFKHAMGPESLLPRTRQYVTPGNTLTLPRDETTPWSTDGVRVYWTGEASSITDSKPIIKTTDIKLHKIAALCPFTSELAEDAPMMVQHINNTVPEKFTYELNRVILEGNGITQPFGINSSGALKVVAETSAQTNDTVSVQNLADMYAAFSGNDAGAIWLHHRTVLAQLLTLTLGQQPVYLPGNRTIDGRPMSNIWGIPAVKSQICQTLGDQGDLYLLDMSKYITVVKSTSMNVAMSIHLWFDIDVNALRFTTRLGGAPWQTAAITDANDGGTSSPFVVLGERDT